jgi:hypothetical protein
LLKRRADILELWKKSADAQKLREKALLLDGGDLALRRSLWRAQTGKELLDEFAIDGKTALQAYSERNESEDTTAALVLDAAATRVYPDGSWVDRIHIIQKALNSNGVSEIAEVEIPPTAKVLKLRTLKADGTSLEPETFEGKETLSMPGVQVGDFVEYEYLQAHPSRAPAQPGFLASTFYFQVAHQPNSWSSYVVAAPPELKMGVDAHNMRVNPPRRVGNEDVFQHEQRHVPPFIPEPDAPPTGTEYLPFVAVGGITEGTGRTLSAFADQVQDASQITEEISAFAQAAVKGQRGLDVVRALHTAVMSRISGQDLGLSQTAAATLAEGRGSRLWLLKAALEAVGIKTRVAAVRTFGADPSPYRYPNESLYPYVCLQVQAPGEEQPIWLDALVRFGPFGELPEQVASKDGYLLPEPGRSLEAIRTPPSREPAGKEVRLKLRLDDQGTLHGVGEEEYSHFEGAQISEALEALAPDQRNQALQGALARYFGGANLSELNVDQKRTDGTRFKVRYVFTAPKFARQESPTRWVLGPLTFPAFLGKRFVQLGQRRTSLFIGQTEKNHTLVDLELPKGFVLSQPGGTMKSRNDFGEFERKETARGSSVHVEERYMLRMARIPPARYEEFAIFAGELDLIQGRDLWMDKK